MRWRSMVSWLDSSDMARARFLINRAKFVTLRKKERTNFMVFYFIENEWIANLWAIIRPDNLNEISADSSLPLERDWRKLVEFRFQFSL